MEKKQDYKPITMKETKEKPKYTKGAGTNGHRDKGWTDAGIARFAELIELVRVQRSGSDRASQEDEALEILRKNPIHGKKTKKRKQPVLEINQPSTRPALTYYNDDDQVMDHVTAVISL